MIAVVTLFDREREFNVSATNYFRLFLIYKTTAAIVNSPGTNTIKSPITGRVIKHTNARMKHIT